MFNIEHEHSSTGQPGSSDEIVPVPAPGKYRRSASRSDLLVNENPSLEVSPHGLPSLGPSSMPLSLVPPPPSANVAPSNGKSGHKRWPPSDVVSVKSKASRIDYSGQNADLMNFWSPPDETMSMVSN